MSHENFDHVETGNFLSLPDEIILIIMKDADQNINLVNRRFHRLYHDIPYWKHLVNIIHELDCYAKPWFIMKSNLRCIFCNKMTEILCEYCSCHICLECGGHPWPGSPCFLCLKANVDKFIHTNCGRTEVYSWRLR